ncbi:ATP-dependent RNA helicase TDRD9-like isoform X2 [Portunus trituberculatus]|nr:ATP-dependent RNA helicase TDRD9-like isoform X2 [Portunus trituberculatus]XP_045135763.1 ATP-dependent RNA helicase TDRD9-like isoform X2 [Portunus trituberculatus]
MMSQPQKFNGTANDFIDWFKGKKFEKVVLPGNKTWIPKQPSSEEYFLPPVAESVRQEQGKAYALHYQEEFLRDVEISIEQRIRKRTHAVSKTLNDDDSVSEGNTGDAGKAHVFLHYDFTTKRRESSLPIFSVEKEILEKITYYQVVVIEGETGCGKSTQVPQFILDEAADKHQYCNIIVTQPRRIAATSLARRVCKERGWQLGKLVGYQVGLDSCKDKDTRLLYVTTETLVQKLVHQRKLDAFTHIILDEVHERDHHTDFALLIIKKLMHTVSPSVKIILMSATINASKFAQYFATPVLGTLLPAPVVSAGDETVHAVQTYYLDSLFNMCQKKPDVLPCLPTIDPDNPGVSEEMFKLAVEMVKCFDDLERQEHEISSKEFFQNRGAVLVFLPGLAEIEQLVNMLAKEASKYQWQLYPLHSTITKEEQQNVFLVPPPGFRKIIISTNIAESSITVQDIKYVIDFCLTKVLTCDEITNYTSLKLAWTSKASCKQRAGRCGRVSSGRVYCLVPKQFYETLPDYASPEMCHTPLTQVILKAKVLDMGEPHSILALALDPPDMGDICRTILILKQMGALSVTASGCRSHLDGDMTYLGKVIVHLPIDPYLAKLIVMGHIMGCLRECIIIAASLSLKPFHARPFQDELNAFLSKVSWAYGSFSDCLAVLNTYDVWQGMQSRGEFLLPGGKAEKEWAKHSYVQLSTLQDVHKLVEELTERLKKLKIVVQAHRSTPRKDQTLILKMCMAAAFFPNYYRRTVPEDYQREVCRELRGNDPFRTVILRGLPAATNIIYDQQIRNLFKECSQNLVISYEGAKAYIQFPNLDGSRVKEEHFQSIPGSCPTTMHLALKMKQVPRINQNLYITLISPEESEQQLQGILGHSSDQYSTTQLLGSESSKAPRQTLGNLAVRVTQPTSNCLKPPELPHAANHTWDIYVTHVVSAGHFWVISSESSNLNNLKYMEEIIMASVQEFTPVLLPVVTPGFVCLAPFTDVQGMQAYYRARLEDVFPSHDKKLKTMVFFVDYGNSEIVDASDLRLLPKRLREIKMLAVECMLAEVKPIAKYSDGSWSPDATKWLQKYALNKKFTVQIYSVVNGVLRVKLLGRENGKFISINQKLISMGHAVKAEEFYLSKQNHELRAIYSSEIEVPEHDENINTSALSSYSFNQSSSDLECSTKVKLRGPDSPLLLRFVALTPSASSKLVRVETSSVNSTALDLEPQNPHERLLIAGNVTLNQSASTATLHNTTLMPSIPGMLPICILLFCPVAEMRVNRTGSHYTGVLVGLGCDERTGQVIYPADDIEVAFDIDITQEDLMLINKIRFLLNVVLEEAEYISGATLISTQKNLHKLILRLLDEKRGYKEPEPYHFPYRWNKVPQEDLLYPEVGGALDDVERSAFPLHRGICLRPDNIAKTS